VSEVLVRVEGRIGRLTLNRPRALNALTIGMIEAIDAALGEWEFAPEIDLVLLDGSGDRGLCSGGDIRTLHAAARTGDIASAATFLKREYRLNAHIAKYPKPYIALMDGIVMGGGIGLSAHGSHRVVTERSRLAMPEVSIGFLPDVGGTWLLGRGPGEFGTHLALTATAIGAADAITCNLADTYVPYMQLPDLVRGLSDCRTRADVTSCLAMHAETPHPGVYSRTCSWVDECYRFDDVGAIVAALRDHGDYEASQAARLISQHAPAALAVTLRALRSARCLENLDHCLKQEYRLALALLQQPDFQEGVRAVVVDKDHTPQWSPRNREDISASWLESLFAPVTSNEFEFTA